MASAPTLLGNAHLDPAVPGILLLLLGLTALTAMYFLPAAIAVLRNVPDVGSVVVVNLFFGWTFVGWVVALALAVRSAPRPSAPPPDVADGTGRR